MTPETETAVRRLLQRIIDAAEGEYDDKDIIGDCPPHAYRLGVMLGNARIALEMMGEQ